MSSIEYQMPPFDYDNIRDAIRDEIGDYRAEQRAELSGIRNMLADTREKVVHGSSITEALQNKTEEIWRTMHGNGRGGCVRQQERILTMIKVLWAVAGTIGIAVSGILVKWIVDR